MKYKKDDVIEFLVQSNWIEGEYSQESLDDAIVAWDFAFNNKNKIDLNYVLMIHKYLMYRLNLRIAGELRRCNVWIGGDKKEYLGREVLIFQIQDVFDMYVNKKYSKRWKTITKDDFAKYGHVLFEGVHPFEDGNGRVGRILWQIHRYKLGLPIEIIHEGEEQMKYYKWFDN